MITRPLVDHRRARSIQTGETDPIGELAALWQAYEPQIQAYGVIIVYLDRPDFEPLSYRMSLGVPPRA